MAVVDKKMYDSTAIKAVKFGGSDAIHIVSVIPITDGDSIASIFRLAQIPSNYIPVWGEVNCEAITSLTDADLGFYLDDEKGGAVKDVDALLDGGDLSSALVPGAGHDALKSIGVPNIGKTVAELLEDNAAKYQSYTLALTLNAAAGATKIATVRMIFVNGA
jgi:hypothetical protein